jgi:isopentenyl-diphosphate delta-isomerase
MDLVQLVDEQDKETGTMEKLLAHREGKLHRALSVIIFNSKRELLLQKRATDKYHSGGLWTNTCCSHPRPGEPVPEAAERRLLEEMGLSCTLIPMFKFVYQEELDNDLTEYELDHVFVGITDDLPVLNPEEAEPYRYISLSALQAEIQEKPENFTVWFKIIIERYSKDLSKYA